jgi:hypothetical protein
MARPWHLKQGAPDAPCGLLTGSYWEGFAQSLDYFILWHQRLTQSLV